MTSYGGYARTGYGAQGGEDGGGFMGASQQGSQGSGEGKSRTDGSLRPVTLKQLVDCKAAYKDADVTIDGMPVTQVTLVGQVRSVTQGPLHITYRIDDGTGLVDVKLWIDADKGETMPRFEPDTYVRIFGRLQTFSGKLSVSAHHIRAIEDFNEVNYHLLEATYVHLSLTKGASTGGGQQQGGDGMDMGGGGDSMFVDGGYGGGAGYSGAMQSRLSSCSRIARTVFNFMADAPGDSQNLTQVAAGTGLSNKDIMNAAEELLGHGIIFTMDDDETWGILDL